MQLAAVRLVNLEVLAAELRQMAVKLDRLENQPWLHPKDVMATLGISKATFYRWLNCGKLPRPQRIYGPIWRRCDLDKAKARLSRADRPERTASGRCPSVRPGKKALF